MFKRHQLVGFALVAAIMLTPARGDVVEPVLSQPVEMSGVCDSELVWSMDELLLEANNNITSSVSLDEDVHVLDWSQPADAQVLSELIPRGDDARLIYDRLAACVVLQWLGYGDAEGDWKFSKPPGQPWHPQKIWAPHPGGGGSESGGGSPAIEFPEVNTLVPEPTTVLVLGLLMLGLFSRSYSNKYSNV